jgi:hypothetical protein
VRQSRPLGSVRGPPGDRRSYRDPADLEDLEADIIRLFRLPPRAATDASHLGLAILHRMDYLLTWNCTHLANAPLQKERMDYCSYNELHTPVVCTPETLIAIDS